MQRLRKIIGVSVIVALAIVVLHLAHTHAFEPLRAQVEGMGLWAPLGIVALRGISILLPALPSTAYSLLAGALLGFETGLITIFITDVVFCQIAFAVAKRYGQKPVQALVGEKASKRITSFNQAQIEGNPFLLTGLLMTGLFDFVSYAAGLGGTKWKTFTPALIISVALSDPPIVALGAGVFSGGKLMLGVALLGVFALAIISGAVKKYQRKNS
ncbi:VTT domain-containing protein [Synechococcus sp. AH-779-G23]|nr:VTT domain-containing protein [Synechococcus sp. AH-779-G23]MDA9638865.1 VTT domain-containing protein [Synechococcus sp. AH-779-G23]